MTTNQIHSALESMGFGIMKGGLIKAAITHPNCHGAEIVPLTVQGLGLAHNWLCQTVDRESQGWAEAVARSRNFLQEVCR